MSISEPMQESEKQKSEAPVFDPSSPDEPLLLPQAREVIAHRDSTRVHHIMPEDWQEMSMHRRVAAILEDEVRREAVGERNHARAVHRGEALSLIHI